MCKILEFHIKSGVCKIKKGFEFYRNWRGWCREFDEQLKLIISNERTDKKEPMR